MKYLRKFATAADETAVKRPGVALYADNGIVEYFPKLPPGVYIQHIDETLYTTSEWSAKGFVKEDANGVAVVGENHGFVVAKTNASDSAAWGGEYKTVADVIDTSVRAEAVLDLDGKGNTDKIIEQLAGYTSSDITGAPAAEAAAAYTFPNGAKGYLPSIGEWTLAFENEQALSSALALIGGATLSTYNKYWWSSTQSSERAAWRIDWYGTSGDPGATGAFYRYSKYRVRAFAVLNV